MTVWDRLERLKRRDPDRAEHLAEMVCAAMANNFQIIEGLSPQESRIVRILQAAPPGEPISGHALTSIVQTRDDCTTVYLAGQAIRRIRRKRPDIGRRIHAQARAGYWWGAG